MLSTNKCDRGFSLNNIPLLVVMSLIICGISTLARADLMETRKSRQTWLSPILNSHVVEPFAGKSCLDKAKHRGVDIVTQRAAGVVAPAEGLVIVAAESDRFFPGLGNLIVIDHGDNTTTVYANLGEHLVQSGDWVRRGQRIAMTQQANPLTKQSRTHVELHVNGKAIDPFKRLPYVFFDLQLAPPLQ